MFVPKERSLNGVDAMMDHELGQDVHNEKDNCSTAGSSSPGQQCWCFDEDEGEDAGPKIRDWGPFSRPLQAIIFCNRRDLHTEMVYALSNLHFESKARIQEAQRHRRRLSNAAFPLSVQ